MQVELKHVRPNPFRNLPHYPIDKEKIAKLKSSIKRTGFWDNIVARKATDNGSVEIAYGHHRRQALIEMYPSTHEINVIVRDLGDGDMIKVMADENDEVYNMTPAVINETVKAARDYLHSPDGETDYKKLLGSRPAPDTRDDIPIARFLDWDVHRVEEALAEIGEIEDPKLTEPERKAKKEIIEEMMPSQNAAREFRRQAAKMNVSVSDQHKVAKEIKAVAQTPKQIGTRDYKKKLIEVKFARKEAEKLQAFSDFLDSVTKSIKETTKKLHELSQYREDFDSATYRNSLEREGIENALAMLALALESVYGGKHGKRSTKSSRLLTN